MKPKIRNLLIILAAAVLILLALCLALLPKSELPRYHDRFILELNDNYPAFSLKDITFQPYLSLSSRDLLGRAGAASACLDQTLMPTESRGSIAEQKPAGWNNESGIFNRSHLIAYQMAGNNDAENLITGTAYLNVEGMLPYENRISMYVKNTGNHVLYRVTPHYHKADLVPYAVQLEAFSLEDYGKGICFNVLIYNIQPGYRINYLTGKASPDASAPVPSASPESIPLVEANPDDAQAEARTMPPLDAEAVTYVLNTKTMRFHYPYCNGVNDMKEKNREDFFGTREEAIAMGYKPCGACNP